MNLIDRYDEIKEYCTLEEYKAYLFRLSANETERISKLNQFEFLMTMPETMRKRWILADIFKEIYESRISFPYPLIK